MIDYAKVIQVIAKTFGGANSYEIEASHDKVDIFDVTIKTDRYETVNCRVIYLKTELEVSFSKGTLRGKEFDRWLSDLEYELEQTFLKNVKVNILDISKEYRFRIII